MDNYRILEIRDHNGSLYYPQKRFLFFFWKSLVQDSRGHGGLFSLENANDLIENDKSGYPLIIIHRQKEKDDG